MVSIGWFVGICSIGLTLGENPSFPYFNGRLPSFHSRVVWNGPDVSWTTRYIEEYHDALNERGKITSKGHDGVRTIYYDNINHLLFDYHVNENNTYSCSFYSTSPTGEYLMPMDTARFFPQDTDPESRKTIAGPSALWAKVNRASTSQTPKYLGRTTVRGIECDAFEFSIQKSKWEQEKISIVFPKDFQWSGLTTLTIRTPLRIVIGGRYDWSKDIIYDFFFDDKDENRFLENMNHFMPMEGIGCTDSSYRRPDDVAKIPEIPFRRYLVDIEMINLIDKMPETLVTFSRQAFDREQLLGRTDDTVNDEFPLSFSTITDLKRGVKYTLVNGVCADRESDKESSFLTEHRKGSKIIDDLFSMNDPLKFVYLGNKMSDRGMLVDVWEKTEPNAMIRGSGQTFSRLVTTIHMSGFGLPVRILFTAYNNPGRYGYGWRKITEIQLNVINFYDLSDVTEFGNIFDASICFANRNRKFFDLFVDMSKLPGDGYRVQYIEQRISVALVKRLRISSLRIPRVKAEFDDRSIRARVLIYDKAPSLESFKNITSAQRDEYIWTNDVYVSDKKTLEDCATAALGAPNAKGFKFCGSKCLAVPYQLDVSFVLKGTKVDSVPCQVYKLNPLLITGAEVNLEPNLKQVTDILLGSVDPLTSSEDDRIKFTVSSVGKDDETQIPIHSITVSDRSSDEVSVRSPFWLAFQNARLVDDQRNIVALENTAFTTLSDCYKQCSESKDIQCESFSFCNEENIMTCTISSIFLPTEVNASRTSLVETHTGCDTYMISYLNKYDETRGILMDKAVGGVSLKTDSLVECARFCSSYEAFDCQSFDFCEPSVTSASHCVIRSTHLLDMDAAHQNEKASCSVFSARSINDYTVTGTDLVKNTRRRMVGASLQECSKQCTESVDTVCVSFNYCPPSSAFDSGFCELSAASVFEAETETQDRDAIMNENCRNYEKRTSVQKRNPSKISLALSRSHMSSSGYSSSGLVGLIFIMLFLGSLVGIVSMFGYNRYQNRSLGDAMGASIRFTRNKEGPYANMA